MAEVYKGTGTKVAKMPGIQPHLDAAAAVVAARAKAIAAEYTDTGAYGRSIGVESVPGKKGVVDREVFADDPAAIPLEFGYVTRGKRPRAVPGRYILTRAMNG